MYHNIIGLLITLHRKTYLVIQQQPITNILKQKTQNNALSCKTKYLESCDPCLMCAQRFHHFNHTIKHMDRPSTYMITRKMILNFEIRLLQTPSLTQSPVMNTKMQGEGIRLVLVYSLYYFRVYTESTYFLLTVPILK